MRRVGTLVVVAIVCMVSSPFAGLPGSDLYLVSVGRGGGAAGSVWYTTVWIHNPEAADVTVTVSMLRRGQQNSSPDRQTIRVRHGETITLSDALVDLFGATSAAGALRFEAPTRIVVSARIFNQTGANVADSQGQFMAGLPAEVAFGLAEATNVPGVTQPADGSFRCNFALVETVGSNATVEVTLYDGGGVELASRSYSLRPFEPMQQNLSHIGAGAIVDGGRLHVAVTSGSGRVLALASMVGNGTVSQDPSTLEMEMHVASASGEGDITAVNAGTGLTGGGTSGSVTLGIDTAGASAGQALVFDGSGIDWGSSGGLSLPFEGQSASGGAAFKIRNSSPSGSAFGIRGESTSNAGAGIFGWANSTTGATAGVIGQSASALGTGVFGLADSNTGTTYGVMGMAASEDGYGVAAIGVNGGADLILGGNANTDIGDDGRIVTDPRYPSSDLVLEANGDVEVHLDADTGEPASFSVFSSYGPRVFSVDEAGNASQPAMASGLAKAGFFGWCGSDEPSVERWFNNIAGAVTVEPGLSGGYCHIDFGFDVSERYLLATPSYSPGIAQVKAINCQPRGIDDTQVTCFLSTPDGTRVAADIAVLVF